VLYSVYVNIVDKLAIVREFYKSYNDVHWDGDIRHCVIFACFIGSVEMACWIKGWLGGSVVERRSLAG